MRKTQNKPPRSQQQILMTQLLVQELRNPEDKRLFINRKTDKSVLRWKEETGKHAISAPTLAPEAVAIQRF